MQKLQHKLQNLSTAERALLIVVVLALLLRLAGVVILPPTIVDDSPWYLDRGARMMTNAITPQEAITVVQVRTTNKEIRKYLNGRKGLKETFHLTVIDKATWTKIDERSFEGGDPPDSIRLKGGGGTSEPVTGPLPAKEIYSYLRRLCGG